MLKIICSTQHIPTYKRRSAPIGNRKQHAPARAHYNQKPLQKTYSIHFPRSVHSEKMPVRSFHSAQLTLGSFSIAIDNPLCYNADTVEVRKELNNMSIWDWLAGLFG